MSEAIHGLIERISHEGLERIPLLKRIEEESKKLFVESSPHIPAGSSPEQRNRIINAALHSNFEGVSDHSQEFYHLLSVSADHQKVTREIIKQALNRLDHGFSKFDALLLRHSCEIATAYDGYYQAWIKAVQGNEVAEKIKKEPPTDKEILENQYTIIQVNEKGEYYDVPYAIYFKKELEPVLKAFDEAVKDLEALKDQGEQQKLYVKYLKHYRTCLAEENKSNLEPLWEELDMIWMDIRYPIQIIHDIESGYGDPLRIKVIPDFSLRFVDEDYKQANETIAKIQSVMVDWFSKRNTDLSRKGLAALSSSFAAIYYLPFQCGMSLHFRFSGQSIPNRSTVKDVKGVKIYFDPISTGNRQRQTGELIKTLYPEAAAQKLISILDPIETLVYQVSPHEVGHAIYNLEHIKGVLESPATRSLLEEPRAELTTLHTIKLLLDSNTISLKEAEKIMSSFAVQDLRRFAMFQASATRPYTISAINTYKVYFQERYITRSGDHLSIDDQKAYDVISKFSQQFELILDAEDRLDGAGIEKILKDMESETDEIHWIVEKLKK